MPVFESLQHAIDRVQNLGGNAGYSDREAHVFAVVLECPLPRLTRGTDYVVNLQLVDESRHQAAVAAAEQLQPVELIIFSQDAALMPQVRTQPGDIIVLRHVMVQFWDPPTGGPRKPQLFGKMKQPHSFGFQLYPARTPSTAAANSGTTFLGAEAFSPASRERPYQSFNVSSFGSPQEKQKLEQLRAFSAQICSPGKAVPDATAIYLRRIKDLEMPEDPNDRPDCVDMRVKVLAIDKREPARQVVLYVWDGTDAKPFPAQQQWPPSLWKDKELKVTRPLQRRVLPLSSQPPSLIVDSNVPPLGSAVPVIIEAENMPRNELPSVGAWVKLKVVGLAAVQGQLQVIYGRDSRLIPSVPGNSFETNYNKRLIEGITSEWPLIETNIATNCSKSELQLVTLRQLQSMVAQQPAEPCRARIRMVGYYPRELQQWCKLVQRPAASAAAAGPPELRQQLQKDWEWAAQLLLEDATGDIKALLMGQHATRLLGLPPHNLAEHAADVQQLRDRLDYLSLVDQDGGVWMDVAITAVHKAEAAQRQTGQQQGSQQERPSSQQEAASAVDAPASGQHNDLQQQQAAPNGVQQVQSPQPGQQVAAGMAGARSPAISGGPSVQQCVYILHDAVSIEMQEQSQHTDETQEHAHETVEGPQNKRQRLDQQPGASSGGAAGARSQAAEAAQAPKQQQLSPRSMRQRDLLHAHVFM